jgi:hypothetical protein
MSKLINCPKHILQKNNVIFFYKFSKSIIDGEINIPEDLFIRYYKKHSFSRLMEPEFNNLCKKILDEYDKLIDENHEKFYRSNHKTYFNPKEAQLSNIDVLYKELLNVKYIIYLIFYQKILRTDLNNTQKIIRILNEYIEFHGHTIPKSIYKLMKYNYSLSEENENKLSKQITYGVKIIRPIEDSIDIVQRSNKSEKFEIIYNDFFGETQTTPENSACLNFFKSANEMFISDNKKDFEYDRLEANTNIYPQYWKNIAKKINSNIVIFYGSTRLLGESYYNIYNTFIPYLGVHYNQSPTINIFISCSNTEIAENLSTSKRNTTEEFGTVKNIEPLISVISFEDRVGNFNNHIFACRSFQLEGAPFLSTSEKREFNDLFNNDKTNPIIFKSDVKLTNDNYYNKKIVQDQFKLIKINLQDFINTRSTKLNNVNSLINVNFDNIKTSFDLHLNNKLFEQVSKVMSPLVSNLEAKAAQVPAAVAQAAASSSKELETIVSASQKVDIAKKLAQTAQAALDLAEQAKLNVIKAPDAAQAAQLAAQAAQLAAQAAQYLRNLKIPAVEAVEAVENALFPEYQKHIFAIVTRLDDFDDIYAKIYDNKHFEDFEFLNIYIDYIKEIKCDNPIKKFVISKYIFCGILFNNVFKIKNTLDLQVHAAAEAQVAAETHAAAQAQAAAEAQVAAETHAAAQAQAAAHLNIYIKIKILFKNSLLELFKYINETNETKFHFSDHYIDEIANKELNANKFRLIYKTLLQNYISACNLCINIPDVIKRSNTKIYSVKLQTDSSVQGNETHCEPWTGDIDLKDETLHFENNINLKILVEILLKKFNITEENKQLIYDQLNADINISNEINIYEKYWNNTINKLISNCLKYVSIDHNRVDNVKKIEELNPKEHYYYENYDFNRKYNEFVDRINPVIEWINSYNIPSEGGKYLMYNIKRKSIKKNNIRKKSITKNNIRKKSITKNNIRKKSITKNNIRKKSITKKTNNYKF